jgi:hypothetical protein
MSTEDRLAIGLTPTGLYSTAQEGAWGFVAHALESRGYVAIAERARDVAGRASGVDVGEDFPLDLVREELELHVELASLVKSDPELANMAAEYVDMIGRRAQDMSEGTSPSVEDKIAREREEALTGQGRRKDVPKDNDEPQKERKLAGEQQPSPGELPSPSGAIEESADSAQSP